MPLRPHPPGRIPEPPRESREWSVRTSTVPFVSAFVMANDAARRVILPPASRRLIPRWVGPLAAAVVMVGLAVAFGAAYWDGYQLRREAATLERERDDLRRSVAQLREEIRLLNTPEYIERLAREQLGLVRPDEIAVILVRPTPAPTPGPPAAAATESVTAPPGPWWTRLWRQRR